MNWSKNFLPIVLASSVALAVWAAAGPEPQRPDAAAIATLSRQANEGQNLGAEMKLRHWASAGLPAARREWGRLLLRRDGMQRDAFHQYELAARDGDADAALFLGNWLRHTPRPQQALAWLRQAAGAGSADAAMTLGRMAEAGEGMPADPDLALHWWQRAAQLGNSEARLLIARERSETASL